MVPHHLPSNGNIIESIAITMETPVIPSMILKNFSGVVGDHFIFDSYDNDSISFYSRIIFGRYGEEKGIWIIKFKGKTVCVLFIVICSFVYSTNRFIKCCFGKTDKYRVVKGVFYKPGNVV